MPSHWHLLVWPRSDEELSPWMRWVTLTHTQRWHVAHHSVGTGPIYQGRFKSFPVESDAHFLTVARYVERNAVRAGHVERAEQWRWSSLWRRRHGGLEDQVLLSDWPIDRPRNWVWRVNQPENNQELESLRRCVKRGRPFGREHWVAATVDRLRLESTMRPPGRPKKKN